jgi:hypothetical protein
MGTAALASVGRFYAIEEVDVIHEEAATPMVARARALDAEV